MLTLDVEGLNNEILKQLKVELGFACREWEEEVASKTTHGLFGKNTKAYIKSHLQKKGNAIIGYLEVNSYVLAESYGTGSYMLENNPWFEEYKAKYWHKYRKSKAIYGREEGYYIDIFGVRRYSTGRLKGRNLEQMKVFTNPNPAGNDYYISPTRPSYAIQLADKWFDTTYLPRAYKNVIEQINFGKYLIES